MPSHDKTSTPLPTDPPFGDELAEPIIQLLANLRGTLHALETAPRSAPEHALIVASRSIRRALDCATHLGELVHERHLHAHRSARSAEAVDLRDVLHSATTMVEPHVERRARLVRRLSVAPVVMASSSRLLQAFIVLLARAAELVPEGAPELHRVSVSLTSEEDENLVTVEIAVSRLESGPENPFATAETPIRVRDPLRLLVAMRFLALENAHVEYLSLGSGGERVRVRFPALVANYDA